MVEDGESSPRTNEPAEREPRLGNSSSSFRTYVPPWMPQLKKVIENHMAPIGAIQSGLFHARIPPSEIIQKCEDSKSEHVACETP
jgi:hypothetical protein